MKEWFVRSVFFSISGPQTLYPDKFFSTEEEGKAYIEQRKAIAEISGTAIIQSVDRILTTVDYEHSLHHIDEATEEKESENASS